MSLNPYAGEWNASLASHLLRRTSFAPKKKNVNEAVSIGMQATVDKLLEYKDPNDYPLNHFFENDPEVAVGETWVNAGITFGVIGIQNYRNRSLGGWVIKKMLEDSFSIQEKLTLFWHNHFVVSDVNDPRFLWRNYSLMRDNCMGDFKQLVKDVTIDPSMLRYLNGRENSKQAPNENYARELLELFTIGKGDLVGDGDYTTFTEHDVVEMAKVLTGWVDRGHNNVFGIPVGSEFVPNRHDTTSKQLSHRFDEVLINNENENEYSTLIDIIFQKEEVSRFIVRKLYRWFVFHDISEFVETDIIEPLALVLRDNDYEIKSVLDVLLRSEHFYTTCEIGALIKSPIDFILNTFALFDSDPVVDNLNQQYSLWFGLLEGAAIIQQVIYQHPSVAGWKAYYQEPVFYRIWLNSVTLPLRATIIDVLWFVGIGLPGNGNYKLDPFQILESVSNPTDINILITEISDGIFPKPLNESQLTYLKNVVLQGLPDFEWTVEYAEYAANPDDVNLETSIGNKLRLLFRSMCQLPEYHLS